MKKILGIVAVALIVGAPALAQNASTMTYTLQLNGTPSATAAAAYDTSTAVEVGPFVMASGVDVLNWSARMTVGGTIDGLMPGGAANVVFDLALKDSTGTLVGGGTGDTDGGFGITATAAEAGFYSIIMNAPGGGPLAQQPAAFPWVFNTWYDPDGNEADANPIPPFDYGRLIDAVVANGPNFAQYTYPSTFKYYRPAGAAAANTTTVTAASGTLMGMGAGYTDFYFTPDAPERGGVGLTAADSQQCYGCTGLWCMEMGNKPLVEGQINMKGLPAGTYTLQLTAGTGNNVLLPTIACSPYGIGTNGAFAAAAATVTGSTITFQYQPVITEIPAPILLPGVASVKTQGGVDYGIPFIGESVTNPGGATTVTVECRANGVTTVVLPFDVAVEAADGTIDGNEITLTGGTLGAITQATPGVLVVGVTGTANATCVKVAVSGLRKAGSGTAGLLVAPATKSIVALRGDVTGNGAVDIGDVNAVKAVSGSALNSSAVAFRRDVTANGAIDIGDVNNVKSLSGTSFIGTCP